MKRRNFIASLFTTAGLFLVTANILGQDKKQSTINGIPVPIESCIIYMVDSGDEIYKNNKIVAELSLRCEARHNAGDLIEVVYISEFTRKIGFQGKIKTCLVDRGKTSITMSNIQGRMDLERCQIV